LKFPPFTTEAKYQNLNFLIFHPIIIQYFGGQNDHYYELLIDHEKCLLFYFKKGCKGTQIAKFGLVNLSSDVTTSVNGPKILDIKVNTHAM
jgi:hypothetical protein